MVTVFVKLLDEGVEVWTPSPATPLGRHRLETPSTYDAETETWEFPPGAEVECRTQTLSDGPALVATSLAD